MDKRLVIDKLFKTIVILASITALSPLAAILATVAARGIHAILEAGPGFFTRLPPTPGSPSIGGIAPALVGSLILTCISSLIGIPLAFFTAAFTVEYPSSRLSRIVSGLCRALSAAPTILVGILVYTLVVVPMGTFSLIAGALALAIVMLPYSYAYIEQALASVPKTYREAAYSIGLSRMKTLIHVLAGVARRGVLAGVLIGVARACGETAPLLFTIGGLTNTVYAGITGPSSAIPLLVYNYAMSPYKNYHELAWGASLVLIVIYLAIFVVARALVGRVRV